MDKAGKPIGRLKIFLGMSAGVGKTYTMLREAQSLVRRGTQVMVAWLEPHGRAETDAQAVGLERIAPVDISYRGIVVQEMNLAGVIASHPALVLVDELAHTNTPGTLHPKRWQDIFDILDAGIDVHTTVNIQHLESIADIVEDMSGISIRERVPDAVFDRADNIQVVDISPEDLQTRLKEGRVYTGTATQQAISHFFRQENLTALRELALSQAAKTAGQQLTHLLQGESISTTQINRQTILVAVSASPNSEYLLRWTRRLAFDLKMDWTCLYVESGNPMSDADKERLVKHLTLARNLGARVTSMINDNVATGILSYARHNRFQILVVGKSGISRPRLFRPAQGITDRLIRESGQISVIAVQERANPLTMTAKLKKKLDTASIWHFLFALLVVAATTGINLLLSPHTGYLSASIIYLTSISLIGLFINRGAVILAALFSAVLWDFLFIPPRFTLFINKTEDFSMLFLYIVLAVTSGWATSRLKSNTRILELREQRMEYLSDLTQAMSTARSLQDVAKQGLSYLNQAFHTDSFLILRDESGHLKTEEILGYPALLDEKDLSALGFCYSSNHTTGRFTSTLPLVKYHFLPMAAPGGSIGVIGLRFDSQAALNDDQQSFLQTLARTISIAVERELLTVENRKNMMLQESERLSTLLIHSISHELRTPLTVIQGSASALTDPETGADTLVRNQLLQNILAGGKRLNEIVENLLSINRLESGLVHLNWQTADPISMIETAVFQCGSLLSAIKVSIGDNSYGLMVNCDEVLVVQVIRNILINASRYTPAGTAVDVRFDPDESRKWLWFTIHDNGPGLTTEELDLMFNKFWRGQKAGNGGTGLGLAICKGVIESHGGTIKATNGGDGGLTLSFSLPLIGYSS